MYQLVPRCHMVIALSLALAHAVIVPAVAITFFIVLCSLCFVLVSVYCSRSASGRQPQTAT